MKRKFILITICLMATLSPMSVYAGDINESQQSYSTTNEISPRANITGYIYKILDGKQWKRLWSYTYDRWEEPNWTLA